MPSPQKMGSIWEVRLSSRTISDHYRFIAGTCCLVLWVLWNLSYTQNRKSPDLIGEVFFSAETGNYIRRCCLENLLGEMTLGEARGMKHDCMDHNLAVWKVKVKIGPRTSKLVLGIYIYIYRCCSTAAYWKRLRLHPFGLTYIKKLPMGGNPNRRYQTGKSLSPHSSMQPLAPWSIFF